jgi:hypothetical protein
MIFCRFFPLPIYSVAGLSVGVDLGLVGCQDARLAGCGTETGNAEVVSGCILDASRREISAAQIDLSEVHPRRDSADSGSRITIYSDTEGNFRFKSVHHGHYALYAPGRDESWTKRLI